MNRNLRDKIDMILEAILGSNVPRGLKALNYKEREEWKNFYGRKIMEAVKESLEDEIKSMAN